jgi:hypothetical protein
MDEKLILSTGFWKKNKRKIKNSRNHGRLKDLVALEEYL